MMNMWVIGRWLEEEGATSPEMKKEFLLKGDTAAHRGIFCEGKDENLSVSGGRAGATSSENLGLEVVVRRPRQNWRRAEGLEGGREAAED
jgi:hypothetical protein